MAQESFASVGDPLFEAVVAVCSSDVKSAETALEKCITWGYTIEDFDADKDLGHAFQSENFKDLRRKLNSAK